MDNQPNGSVGVPPQPSQQPAPVAQMPQQPQQPMATVPTSGGSKTKYIIGVVAAIVLIFGGLLFLAMPTLQANAKATAFMEAVKKNDEKAMQDLSGSGRDGLTDKLNAALKAGNYKHTTTDKKDKSYVVHFNITGSDAVKDAVIVVENRMVGNLLLNTKGGTTSTTTAPATSSGACLTVADLKAAGVTNIDSLSIPQSLASLYFKADSTEYDQSYSNDFSLRDVAKTFTAVKDKTFTLTIRGSVNDTTASAANDKLANDRAAKVKADLVAKGVDASRITIDAPEQGSISTDPVTYRTVLVRVSVPSNCGVQSDPSGR